ncbi:MAG: XF1762 family protein [Steroidobacteraceae bacterium]
MASCSSLRKCALTIKAASRFVSKNHRHNKPPQGGLFAVGAKCGEQLVGAAIIGRPVARMLDDGETCEVTRLCTDGSRNACSLLYGAAARAAEALGYRRIITYTLASESGVSLRAAGWQIDAEVNGEKSWNRPSRYRVQTDLFGYEQRPTEDKVRWSKNLIRNSKIIGSNGRARLGGQP